jgi:PAS domain S-box-containing protein
VLHLEDSPRDAELVQQNLETGGLACDIVLVDGKEAFEAALARNVYDIIFCDHNLPYDGRSVIKLAREKLPLVPIISLSGTLGEEEAVECLKLGATDYVLKHGLERLVPAVRRALQEAEEHRARLQAEAESRASEEQFRAMFEMAAIGMAQTDPHTGQWLRVNKKMCAITGYSAAELLKMRVPELTHPDDREKDWSQFERVVRGEAANYRMEKRYVRKDGTVAWVNVNMTIIRDAAGQPVRAMATIEEITERRQAEQRVRELNLLLRAIGAVNALMVRERDPKRLLTEACEILVETRGYRFAWIGLVEPGSKRVMPQACAGKDSGYFDSLTITWDETPSGRGPIGTAIRTGNPVSCQDIATDPRLAPYREDAKDHGVASLAAMPMTYDSRVLGALVVYSARAGTFDAEELGLLNALAGDLAFALQSIEHRQERNRAEAALLQREKYFRALTEGATDVTSLLDADGTMRYQSPSSEQVFGYRPDELFGRNAFEFIYPDDQARVQQALAELTATPGATTRIEFRFRHKEGSWHMLEATARNLLDDPNVKGVVVNSRDNTERNRLEEALRESESLLRESQAIAGLGSYIMDIPTGRWKSSEVLNRVLGLDPAYDRSVAGWVALVHSEDRAMMLDYFNNEVLARGQSFDKEYRIIRRSDQAVRWVHGLGRLEFDSEGRPWKMLGTIQDITERKQAEAALQLGKRAINAATEGICITRSAAAGAELVYVNQGFERLTGYRAEEVLGRNIQFLQGAETSPAAVDSLRAAIEAGEACTLELLNYRKDGTRFWNRVSITPVTNDAGAVSHFVAILDDVTWGKEAELALRDLSQFNREIIDSAQEGIVVYGPDLKYKVWNHYMERLSGCSAAEVLGKRAVEVFPFLHAPEMAAAWAKALAGGEPTTMEFEYRVPRTDRRGWASDTSGPLRDSQGKLVGIISLVRDITERKRAREELHASEVRYRRLFEAAKDGVLILDAETGIVLDVNPFLLQLLGSSRETILGKKVWELGFFKDILANQANFETLRQQEHIRYEDKPLKTTDGRVIDVEFVSNVYLADHQKVIQCNIRDITARKRTEWLELIYRDQLRALAARIETMREEERTRISREIHDELGQMLTAIKMDLRWMEHRLDEFGDDRRVNLILDKLVATAELTDATVKIVQRIAAELRPGILDKLGLPIALQYEAARFQERTGITCRLVVPAETPPLKPEAATTFFRIFQEAVTNVARHAQATAVEVELQPQADGCRLEIRDNGKGMAGVDLPHLKSLGLLGMRERATLLGGEVSFAPRPGGGTVVTVWIPNSPTNA